jgi:hypothetical protein
VTPEIQILVSLHVDVVPINFESIMLQATFLIMQGAEKTPAAILNVIKADIKSVFGSMLLRKQAIHVLYQAWTLPVVS